MQIFKNYICKNISILSLHVEKKKNCYLMIHNMPFSLLYGKRWNKKNVTNGKSGQKELLVFHGQLNWYIFHIFHYKNTFHIHWTNYHFLKYIKRSKQEPFLFQQKEMLLNFPGCQIFLNIAHKVYNHYILMIHLGNVLADSNTTDFIPCLDPFV